MTIANGKTNCEAEREVLTQCYVDLIEELILQQNSSEASLKAHMYDIFVSSYEEDVKSTLLKPYLQALEDSKEKASRIRKYIILGIYSIWEESIKEIRSFYKIEVNQSNQAQASFIRTDPNIQACLKQIFEKDPESIPSIINDNFREFRNYLAHSSLTPLRSRLITSLVSIQKYDINGDGKSFYLSSYEGLKNILYLFLKEMDNVENYVKCNFKSKLN